MLAFFETRSAQAERMALVTVLSTEGSSYSKAGHPLLVSDTGDVAGLLSGGCLETDLVARCREAIRDGRPRLVDYDLRDDDWLFGLGVGCEGVMRVLLYPMSAATEYEPIASARQRLRDREFVDLDICAGERLFHVRWVRPANVLVLGAGTDAMPLLQLCRSLGWRVTVVDHRPAWIDRVESAGTVTFMHVTARTLARDVDLQRFDAAIVKSHDLETDRNYLGQLAQSDVGFIGLLGPPQRRDRILEELADAALLEGRLRSPVGMKIGGRGPAAIALEIAAELQSYFCDVDRRLAASARSSGKSISIDAGANSTDTTDSP